LRRSPAQLAALAAGLGSDISFFLHLPSAVCTGVGETVAPIPAPAPRWALLIFPPFAMATPRVYREFDEMKLGDTSAIETQPNWLAWAALPAGQLLPKLINDLEAPAFHLNPPLGRLRAEWENQLGRPVRMSGSGSTLFTLFDHREEADAAIAETSQRVSIVELAPEISDDLATPR
jgi:4-diphosphocytidyl-2-C-methyl-D-erythritol kinase